MPGSSKIDTLGIEVSGGELAAFRFGPGPSSAPSVLAVHGITANSRAWLPTARALDGIATLIAPDLRGRGASNSLPAPYGIAEHVADMRAVLEQLGQERAVVVGHSLGAYIAARLAVEHPDRVRALVLVDGGLTIPGSEGVEPQAFADAFLGPALARLRLRFANREAYHDWWRKHPAFAAGDITDEDLAAYADHDLVGTEPELRSSVAEPAVRADAGGLAEMGVSAHRLQVPANLLCAPRGLLDDPNPMQPFPLVQAWAAERPDQRQASPVADVNHYTITLGPRGATAVAAAIAACLSE
jgi:pimeloyl-ACP methyl ester carboxylesterase